MIRALLVAALAGATALAAAAAEPPRSDMKGTLSLTFENDVFGGTDKYYTTGWQVSWRSPSYDPPAWLAWIGDATVPFFPSGGSQRWGLAFGQSIFTPSDTELRVPDPKDRPYAGWLYGAFSITSYTNSSYGSFEVQLGVVGPSSLAEQVQNNTHDLINVDRALGWDHQLHDEPGINLILTRQWRYNRQVVTSPFGDLQVGVVPSLTGSLGNVQTYAAAGGIVRIGNKLDADFGTPRMRPTTAGSAFFNPEQQWGWYVFAGLEGRAIARDIFLDGNTWADSPSVDKRNFIGDASLGGALFTPWGRLTYTHTFRTKEFYGQKETSEFGSINFSMRF